MAIATVHLIDQLERSREEIARRAEAERTLREIAARVSAILDPADVLERIVFEAARILGSDGARIDLWDEDLEALRWAYASGDAMREVPDWGRDGGLRPRQAVAGLAFAELAPVMTPDYLRRRALRDDPGDRGVRRGPPASGRSSPRRSSARPGRWACCRSCRARPGAYSRRGRRDRLGAGHPGVHRHHQRQPDGPARPLADATSSAARRRSRALREIGASLTTMREPATCSSGVADESVRLLRADGAVIDQFDPDNETLRWAYDSGISDAQREGVKLTNLRLGEGVSGKAVAEGRVITVGDYMAAEFQHDELADSLASGEGLRDLIVAPIIGDGRPLGAIEVFSRSPHAFDSLDVAFLGRSPSRPPSPSPTPGSSRSCDARRPPSRDGPRRSARCATSPPGSPRCTTRSEVLGRVVEDAMRLLGTDGAHLTRMAEPARYLVPVVVAGAADDVDHAWLMAHGVPARRGHQRPGRRSWAGRSRPSTT